MADRYTYRNIVRELTTPLITAYRQMIQLQLQSQYIGDPPRYTVQPKTIRHTRLLFHNATPDTVIPCLLPQHIHDTTSTFTYSDAAFGLPDAAIGILHDPISY